MTKLLSLIVAAAFAAASATAIAQEKKAAAARMAGMTSRFNTMLSIPMLYFMVAQQHAGVMFR